VTQEVFDFFEREHGLILLESEYTDIQHVVNADLCAEVVYWKNRLSRADAQLATVLSERNEARKFVAEIWAICMILIEPMDELLNHADGPEADRVFPQYEFDALREVLKKAEAMR